MKERSPIIYPNYQTTKFIGRNEKGSAPTEPKGNHLFMNIDTELDCNFDEPADDPHSQDEDEAADLIIRLRILFERPVSTRSQLHTATNILYQVERLCINRQSDAWREVERLRRMWKTRLQAQDDIDRWMIQHGHPPY